MAIASFLGAGMRASALRIGSGRLTVPVITSCQRRQFSAFMSQDFRTFQQCEVRQSPSCARNFSLFPWRTTPNASTPSPAPTPAPEVPPPPPPVPSNPTSDVTAPSEEPAAASSLPSGTEVVASSPQVPATDAVPLPVEAVGEVPIPDVGLAPLHFGELADMGLAGWGPSGLIVRLLEIVNLTGLPWFWTIVASMILVRVALLPLAISSARSAARLAPHAQRLKDIQAEANVARASGDQLALQRCALQQKAIYEKNGINPLMSLGGALGNGVAAYAFVIGLRRLCLHPVEQLKHSGLDIVPDLTAFDPWYGLPLVVTALINAQISLASKDVATPGHAMNYFRILSVAGLWFMTKLPDAALVSIVTGAVFTAIQTYALQRPAVRARLDIPPHPKDAPKGPTIMETLRHTRNWALEQYNVRFGSKKSLPSPPKRSRR